MIGQTISHYKILEKLGEGGMGVVYKAEDIKLKRTVALKLLPRQAVARDVDKARFEREAQSAANLNHPNIATIYEFDEADGQAFIAMEYIDGETVKQKIKERPLPVDEAIKIATATAEGLAEAHGKGIVHRDIKSDNIMVSRNRTVKIMDFGLAAVAGRSRVTKEGMTVGTVTYMSPEQALGEKLDQRTDIWSVGVVMYEMIMGRLPFAGDYEQAIVYRILNEEPQPVASLRSNVPMELERIVTKAMQKDQGARYQTTQDLLADLRSLAKTSEVDKRPSVRSEFAIAVLPFVNVRNDPEFDFLGFALADQIIGSLSYVQDMQVRPSSAVRPYQTQMVDARTAGRHLQVEFILAGNFLKEADIVRLNVELVNVQSNVIVWREPVQVKYENTFALQDLVSEKVIKGLRVQFSQGERDRMRADVPNDPLAYEYYLRAVSYPVTLEGDELAIAMLEKSVSLDPTYAPAYSELGFRLYQLAASAMLGLEKCREAEAAFRKALDLNENLLTALWHLSLHYTEIGKSQEAFDLIQQMFRVTPNNAMAHYALGYLYRYTGMLEESMQEVEKALALDPKNPRFRSAGFTYIYLGEYQKAYEVFDLDRESTLSLAWKGMALFLQGERERPIEFFDRAIELEPKGYIGLRHRGIRAFLKGDFQDGLRALGELEAANPSDSDSEHWYLIGNAYALLGDKAGCFRGLRKAVECGFFNYAGMLKDPLLDSVRDDPEFQRVLVMAKEKHEVFKKELLPSKL